MVFRAQRFAWMAVAVLGAAAVGCGGEAAGEPRQAGQGAGQPETGFAETADGPEAKEDWYAQHHSMKRTPCGSGCRYATHVHSEVRLTLAPNGYAESMDHGERLEETVSAVGNNSRITRWRRQWRGSWTEGPDSYVVKLKPHALECERETQDGTRDQPCRNKPLKLVCERADVKVSEPTKQLVDGWVCVPQRRARMDELTPMPWVFGQEQWLLAMDRGDNTRRSRARRRYAIGDVASDVAAPRKRRR